MTAMYRLLTLCLMLSLTGCDLLPRRGTDQINQSLQLVDDQAQGIIDDLAAAQVEPDPLPLIQHAQGRASSIRAEVAKGRAALNKVEDRGTTLEDWLRFGQTWAWVALIAAAVGGMMYLGLGPVVRKAFAHIGLLIPDPIKRDAQDDAHLVRTGKARSEDFARIGRWQQADPLYRIALDKELKR